MKELSGTKNALWQNLQTWANAVSTECVRKIEFTDQENGTMILKVESYLPSKIPDFTEYSKVKVIMNVKVDCRDN